MKLQTVTPCVKNKRTPAEQQRNYYEQIKDDRRESYYRDRLAAHFNGLTEVKANCGIIDIITDRYLIECKWSKQWKAALGQAICYKKDYNTHTPVVFLFGKPKDIDMASYFDAVGITLWTPATFPELFAD